jgi:SAM-dependent methyltransferase
VRRRTAPRELLSGEVHEGHCPVCETQTLFVIRSNWLRDGYVCLRCKSIPRWRAIVHVLSQQFPNWRSLVIHESSPGGPASKKLRRECRNYLPTHYFPDVSSGSIHRGFRSENLERQTFPDQSFDLVVTQDVFEHIFHPGDAFREIARTLKPRGAHVFTVPWYKDKPTLVRATEADGMIEHLRAPDYHINPIDKSGSLVVTEWGSDLCDFIRNESGLETMVFDSRDRYLGIDGEFRDVFVSRKNQVV